jgi:uncharacterized protein YjbI with pentapeptide repeats
MGRISIRRPAQRFVVLALAALLVGASALTVRALATSPKAHSAGRNTCTGELRDGGFAQTRLMAPQLLQSAELNNSHDNWSVYPNHNQHYWKWSSYSGFLRGCSNTVRFGDRRGTIEIYLSDPYSGRNSWQCKATGQLRCSAPSGTFGGDHLSLTYHTEEEPSVAPPPRPPDPCLIVKHPTEEHHTSCPGAYLSGVDLDEADLFDADLTGAKLVKAKLNRADLRSAKLTGADMGDAELKSANLNKADLRGAELPEAKLHAANLSHACVFKANLSDANLSDANLSQANLVEANLIEAKLGGASLSGAILTRANLSHAKNANLSGAKLCDTVMPDQTLSNCRPRPVRFLCK